MRNIFFRIKNTIQTKKSLFVFLILLALTFVVLGVVASINFSSETLTIDLSNISYVKFLKNESGFASLIIKLSFGLILFITIILCCGYKPFLFPISLMFYCYLVYSQTVVFVSMILIYGFFNCIIFVFLLLIYIIVIVSIFILYVLEISNFCGCVNYFKSIINKNNSNILIYILLIILINIIFCLILIILKSFVLLLIY